MYQHIHMFVITWFDVIVKAWLSTLQTTHLASISKSIMNINNVVFKYNKNHINGA